MAQLESAFQRKLIDEIQDLYPDAIVTKIPGGVRQGIPDIQILYGPKWATLECKRSEKEKHRPNQDWYVHKMNRMSFSRFIYPENREEVLGELKAFLGK